jgi:hypothetical protein
MRRATLPACMAYQLYTIRPFRMMHSLLILSPVSVMRLTHYNNNNFFLVPKKEKKRKKF